MLSSIALAHAGAPGALRGSLSIEESARQWLDWVEHHVPPLRHPRGKRWPLVTWLGPEHLPLTPEQANLLLARGLTQHLEIDVAMIPAAKILQAAGSPVILMEGKRGPWPYDQGGDPTLWSHDHPDNLPVPDSWRTIPSPGLFQGWARAADQLRHTLQEFKNQGVTIDGLWLDHEGQPSQAAYLPALLSPRTRSILPRGALKDEPSFAIFRRQLWMQLLSAYIAAPAREIFPAIAVTNWVAALSTPEHPLYGWDDRPHPLTGPTLMTHSAPLAYGVDTYLLTVRDKEKPLDAAMVDRLFTHLLLRQVSEDAFNRTRLAPHLGSLPWVARRVVDHPDTTTPALSRSTYREILRHLWLRGIDGMQVFNVGPGGANDPLAREEILDAQAVYDEMLAFRPFLEEGTVMNLDNPGPRDETIVWSGLRRRNQALIRLFFHGRGHQTRSIEPWPGQKVSLTTSSSGTTCLLTRKTKPEDIQIDCN
ncbi:MAG: hypothetical protein HQL76_10820 [Magnetococcales bacterium]|nr:hypothetical protein [Magnetococcales bacterium]